MRVTQRKLCWLELEHFKGTFQSEPKFKRFVYYPSTSNPRQLTKLLDLLTPTIIFRETKKQKQHSHL